MKLIFTFFVIFLCSVHSVVASAPPERWIGRGQSVLEGLNARMCQESRNQPLLDEKSASYGAILARDAFSSACEKDPLTASFSPDLPEASPKITGAADGDVIARSRLMADFGIAVDLVAYASSGLVVGGVLCYPDDGQPHSTVLHLHGGFGGIFDPDGDMVVACVNWALLHDRTAFAPSFRGQDGGEGTMELCLGEADDVAAAAIMVRNLKVTDPDRLAVVGGSTGGCVALRAGAMIPNLKAVVSYVPPSDWKTLVDFHRTTYVPEIERTCDGGTVAWDVGGPVMADVIDNAICGHPFCSDEDYEARSTIPGVFVQTAPTLIISAEADNIVPLEQQILYSMLRQELGNPVDIYVVDPCGPSSAPPIATDVHVMVTDTYHGLSPATISDGLLFLMDALDR